MRVYCHVFKVASLIFPHTLQTRPDEAPDREADEPSVQPYPRPLAPITAPCIGQRTSIVQTCIFCASDRLLRGAEHGSSQDIVRIRHGLHAQRIPRRTLYLAPALP